MGVTRGRERHERKGGLTPPVAPFISNHGLNIMSAKDVRFSSDARDRMLRWRSIILNNAVKVTLGPKSRSVILDKSYGAPRITKDGVTVAKEIELRRQVREHGRSDGARGRLEDQ